MKVAALETCDRVRVRALRPKDGSDVVLEYADAYRCGLITEPLDVFREKGTERYVVADGENRLLALRAAKIAEVPVRLHEGDEVAALDFAIGCNQTHGLRRSKADKYHAFARIMETSELRDKYRTDTELSEKVGVSKRTIADYKVEWRNSESSSKPARRAKEKAQTTAHKHNGVEHREVKKADPAPRAAKPATRAKPATHESAKSNGDSGWTKQDERDSSDLLDLLAAFCKRYNAASRPAQIHVRDVVVKTIRDLA